MFDRTLYIEGGEDRLFVDKFGNLLFHPDGFLYCEVNGVACYENIYIYDYSDHNLEKIDLLI